MSERYYSFSRYLKETFGKKFYKICLDGGFTCPNRDGTISTGGCIFCSEKGSGDYTEQACLSIREQLQLGKNQTAGKYQGDTYIAYFQAFTNTYAPVDYLRELYEQAIEDPCVAVVAIGTRPDCLSEEVLDLLEELNQRKPIWIELGFQTCHDHTARFINRGYPSSVFADAVHRCHDRGLRLACHLILGLPGESKEMQYETIDFVNQLPIDGIKLSMLYVLKHTALGRMYAKEPFPVYSMEEYIDCLIGCIERMRPDIVIERTTGDSPEGLLIAPEWIPKKRTVLNSIQKELKRRDTYQGRLYT